ncbi:Bug family tripartite tricarboxylate transporter substrate binding protein [Hydrogenophaga sp.]|uniref:Bug family tripartite tricarboxylate transporter substrate binding protein n=1 Tax=Hydrogenophaga sp. TaxID=1904254 RepID=UPI003F725950
MTLSRRQLIPAMLAGAALRAMAAGPSWPTQPLRIIVVYPPGGLSDGVARSLADRLAAQLGVPVRVEHRAGGGGSVGMQALARATADGHTLAFSAVSPLTLRPHLSAIGYEPFRDIEPVASVMYTPVLLVGTPAFSGDSFADLLAQARARPKALRWATSGLATAGHLVLEQVQIGAGIEVTHIPYKGGGQQLTDALGGQFELLSTNVAPTQLRHIEAGRFRPLAVGAPHRLDALGQVPTFTELGLPNANITSLFGLFAPSGTPEAVLERLNAEINVAVRAPEIRERLLASDNLPALEDRSSFVRRIAHEWRNNRQLRNSNIRMD